MKKIAIIDMGSNSVRLILVKIQDDHTFQVVDELKETVRLGQDMGEEQLLQTLSMEKALQTLSLFKNLCDAAQVTQVIAVATAAVRKAKNQLEFLSRIQQEFGIDFRILSGDEEAYYDYFGTVNTLTVEDALLMDIGGGSMEFIWMKERKIVERISIPIGAINLTQRFQLENHFTSEQAQVLQNYLFNEFNRIPWLSQIKHKHLIGIGGTFRNIGKIHKRKIDYPFDSTHNFKMSHTDLFTIYDQIKNKSKAQRGKIKGLSQDRADIFAGACAAICAISQYCDISDITISGNGIREGLFYEYMLQKSTPIEDIHTFSLTNLMTRYDVEPQHAWHVYYLARSLYQQLQTLIKVNSSTERILKTAALLHDCGISIQYYDHHLHSFYMILHSGVYGLTQKELILSAYIASAHRNNDDKQNWFPFQTIVDEEDITLVEQLGLLLRISECLDRSMNRRIREIECHLKGDTIVIRTIASSDTRLEINEARLACSTFKKVFKKELVLL